MGSFVSRVENDQHHDDSSRRSGTDVRKCYALQFECTERDNYIVNNEVHNDEMKGTSSR